MTTEEQQKRYEHRLQQNREYAKKNRNKIRSLRRKYLEENKEAYKNGTKQRAKERKCYICNRVKPASKFYISNSTADGLHPCCKKCSNEHALQNQHKRKFGITAEESKALLKAQGYKCAICGRKRSKKRKLAIDHNHTTGKMRGIICIQCNSMLGHAKDNIETLKSAIVYIKKYKQEEDNANKSSKKRKRAQDT